MVLDLKTFYACKRKPGMKTTLNKKLISLISPDVSKMCNCEGLK